MPTEECPFKAGDTVRSQVTNTTYTIEKIFWSNSQGQWEVHLVGHKSRHQARIFTLVESNTLGITLFFRDMEGKYKS